MATEAQIEANRRNAQRSTGPKTEQGKAVVGGNAITHGLFANSWKLPGEDAGQFEAFADAVVADLRPEGMNQLLLAKRIAHIQWKLDRIPEIEAAVTFNLGGGRVGAEERPTAEVISRDLDVYLRYQLYEQRLERSLRAYLKEYRQLKKEAAERATAVEEDDTDAAAHAADALHQYLSYGSPMTDENDDRNASATSVAASEDEMKKQTQFAPNDRPDKVLRVLDDIHVASAMEAE